MAHFNAWLHLIWSTQNCEPFLKKEIQPLVWRHIHEYGISKGVQVDIVNGSADHVHCLISLEAELSVGKTLNLLKGESSHWINKQGFVSPKFQWEPDYWAMSIGFDHLENVRTYILNQEAHHATRTFQQEKDSFIKKYWSNLEVD